MHSNIPSTSSLSAAAASSLWLPLDSLPVEQPMDDIEPISDDRNNNNQVHSPTPMTIASTATASSEAIRTNLWQALLDDDAERLQFLLQQQQQQSQQSLRMKWNFLLPPSVMTESQHGEQRFYHPQPSSTTDQTTSLAGTTRFWFPEQQDQPPHEEHDGSSTRRIVGRGVTAATEGRIRDSSWRGPPLLWACRHGNIATVQVLLQYGSDDCFQRMQKAMMTATTTKTQRMDRHNHNERSYKSTSTATYLIKQSRDRRGWNPLIWAIALDHVLIIHALIDAGAPVRHSPPPLLPSPGGKVMMINCFDDDINNKTNKNTSTAGYSAMDTITTTTTTTTIAATTTDACESGNTVFHHEIPLLVLAMDRCQNPLPIVRRLLEAGADPNQSCLAGISPLQYAILLAQGKKSRRRQGPQQQQHQRQTYNNVQTTTTEGSSSEELSHCSPSTASSTASLVNASTELVRILLQYGANPSERVCGETLLFMASSPDLVHLLIEYGGIPVDETNRLGDTPLLSWIRRSCQQQQQQQNQSNQSSSSQQQQQQQSQSCSTAAVETTGPIQALTQHGADVWATNLWGQSPVRQAFLKGNVTTIYHLLEARPHLIYRDPLDCCF